ncbi:hypothetical protein FZC35_02220 [Candidatus Cytomitobacter indipagum]|uniref:Uncharacterized protein n=1 Tax=Candidatus Cytomitobacter indipagum TaxID=2601575 RepID=A0A5C0UEN2_9PROT|nr:hypothetical protein [Candidatus Cytomitobacter indipagum]QEK38177.1 hypothetical protein FZC35_02220 [Candidatus Cytomitobacter indipagum]
MKLKILFLSCCVAIYSHNDDLVVKSEPSFHLEDSCGQINEFYLDNLQSIVLGMIDMKSSLHNYYNSIESNCGLMNNEKRLEILNSMRKIHSMIDFLRILKKNFFDKNESSSNLTEVDVFSCDLDDIESDVRCFINQLSASSKMICNAINYAFVEEENEEEDVSIVRVKYYCSALDFHLNNLLFFIENSNLNSDALSANEQKTNEITVDMEMAQENQKSFCLIRFCKIIGDFFGRCNNINKIHPEIYKS